MAEITLGTIQEAGNTQTQLVQFGETVTPGECVYKKSDNKYWLADNTTTTLAAAAGFAITGNAADGYGRIAVGGDVDLGATLVLATEYVVGSTGGAIHPNGADLLTGEIYTRVGYGKTAALLTIDIARTEVVAP